jgi:hypothetical protein
MLGIRRQQCRVDRMSLRSKHAFRTSKVMVIATDWEKSGLFLVSVKRCSDVSLVIQVGLNSQNEECHRRPTAWK